jgi:hypothetical protein
MNPRFLTSLLLGLGLLGTSAAIAAPGWVEASTSGRVGYDSNVTAIGPDAAGAIPKADSLVLSAGVQLGADLVKQGALAGDWKAARVSLGVEANRFPSLTEEDFVCARLGLVLKHQSATDLLTFDASVVRIEGSEDTYDLTSTLHAYGLPVWRERRTQWQHRGRVQWTHTQGKLLTRLTGSTLVFDLDTSTRASCVTYVDRADSWVGAEVGTALGAGQAFVGVQAGRQSQDTAQVAGGQYEYSNHYRRLTAAWAGKLGSRTKVSVAAGPDWRDYDGNVAAALTERTRRSWFVEADASVELSPRWTLTGKATRFLWVSSTGKSAYADLTLESGVVHKATQKLQWKLAARLQQSDYFPQVRDDWLASALGAIDYTVTPELKVGADLTYQYGWSALQPVKGRSFERTLLSFRASLAF